LRQEISNRRRKKLRKPKTKIDEVGVEDTSAYHNPREIFNTQRSP
jgi:CelD/BcsL family acetyltransferase involved in cellulose biosynthesis